MRRLICPLEQENERAGPPRRTFADVAGMDGAVGGGARPKPNDTLRPKVLQITDTPRYLDNWTRQFRAYNESSRLDLESFEVQRIYFIAAISEA